MYRMRANYNKKSNNNKIYPINGDRKPNPAAPAPAAAAPDAPASAPAAAVKRFVARIDWQSFGDAADLARVRGIALLALPPTLALALALTLALPLALTLTLTLTLALALARTARIEGVEAHEQNIHEHAQRPG